jgi:hypothetical protein
VVLLASEASRHITGQAIAVGRRRDGHIDAREMNPLEYTREYQKKIPFLAHLKILTEDSGKARRSCPCPSSRTSPTAWARFTAA